ncbi:MAG TPA: GNAT family N-acetyltransferase, partial [Stellaceae bacterium]|nr:GNAT family N-acetyltransferase [Stellaceae bacterium]
ASAIIWVLHDNPARFFYRRLGGREVQHKMFTVGGKQVEAAGYAWRDLPRFLETTTQADGHPQP